MIDTDKYEGHVKEEWCRESNDLYFHRDGKDIQIADILSRGDGDERYHEDVANAKLIADAPLLLAEVKRLRKGIIDIANKWEQPSIIRGFLKELKELIE